MITRAPGKLVLSGAYSVLRGAPALVTAVDRYVTADTAQPARWVTPEVAAALGDKSAPEFDASALRHGDMKLGLGSSAAIVVASLAAVALDGAEALDLASLRPRLFRQALLAHRRAQGGGSGIDVAASTFGGNLQYRLVGDTPNYTSVPRPGGLVLEVWSAGSPASTPALLQRVARLREQDRLLHDRLLDAQGDAAEQTAASWAEADLERLLAGVRRQSEALHALGRAVDAPIVSDAVLQLDRCAAQQGAAVLPSGAGGGDVHIFWGLAPATESWRVLARSLGHFPIALGLGARGVHAQA